MNAAAALWKSLLNLARRSALDGGAASRPAPPAYAMWLEDLSCGVDGCGVCAAAGRERDVPLPEWEPLVRAVHITDWNTERPAVGPGRHRAPR